MVFTLIARVALNISRKILAVMPRKLIIVFCRIENVKHEGMILKISHRSQSINLQSISLSINTKEWIYDTLNPSFEDSPQLSIYRSQYSLITKTIFTSKHNIKCCAPKFHYHSQDNNYNTSWSAPKIDDSLHKAIPNSQLVNKDNRHYSENFILISSISHAEFQAYTRVRNVPKTRTQKERSWHRGRHLFGAARFLERFVTLVGGIKSDIKLGACIWTIF